MKAIVFITIAWVTSMVIYAQDVYYSQFYAAPLALNPAMTGFSNGDLRVAVNYRNSSQGYIPYNTYSGSFDMKIMRETVKPDVMAVGLIMTNDNMGNGALTNLSTAASGAYHKAVDGKGNHFVSGGFQTGFYQRSANASVFSFGNQWDDLVGFNQYAASGESIGTSASSWVFDLNMGLMWYSRFNEKTALYAGSSVFHLTQPVESFAGLDQKLARRFVQHLGFRFAITEVISIIPNVIYMTQNKAQQLATGMSYEFFIGETNNTFRFGTWYRHSDQSFIFSAGVQVREFILGISSDFISPVTKYTRTQGAFELSLAYSPSLSKTARLRADPTRRF